MRLFSQVYFASLAFVLFSMALLAAIVSYRDSSYSLAALRNEQRLLAVTAASQVEAGYHENIWPFGMLWAITKEPEFAFWQIIDGDGRSVLADGSLRAPFPDAARPVRDPRWAAALGPSARDVEEWAVPLALGSPSRPWVFRLGFKTTRVREHVWRDVVTNALVAIGIALLLIGVSFVFTKRLLGPLRSLTEAAEQLERGNLGVSLSTDQGDELGQLMRAFGSMVASIKQRDVAIQEHLESLRGARDDLEVREARLRAIIDHAADGIISTDERGNVEVFNPSAERIFGYGPDEVLGKRLDPLFSPGFGIDEAGEIVERTGPSVLSHGRAAEILAVRKDGAVFPLQIAVSDVHVGGSLRLRTAIVRDISERRRAEADRKEIHARLLQASRQAGMAEVATSVLHNVGNVLNSINVSAGVLSAALRESRVGGLGRASALMQAHAADLGEFVTSHPSGKLLPDYLGELARVLEAERQTALKELSSLLANIEHVKAVVTQQQGYARTPAVEVAEDVRIDDLCDDALKICGADLGSWTIQTVRRYARLPSVRLDRHKLLQILINLVSNAKHALVAIEPGQRRLLVETGIDDAGMLLVRVADNGAGIAPENIVKIFRYGFTTKKGGHGFGLHGSALAAEQLGGALSVESAGLGHGATFVLRVPARPEADTPSHEDHDEHAA